MTEQEKLMGGFEAYHLPLSQKAVDNFMIFTEELLETNKVMNLTAITDRDEIISKHYLDSVFPLTLPYFQKGCSVIDVGCGAGFPGIPIKIAREDMELTLLDSLNKRIDFLKRSVEKMGMEKVTCIHERAEEGAKKPKYREKYDIAISRAVANLRVLTELCCGYVKVGGYFIALKGPGGHNELEEAKSAIGTMGCKLVDVVSAPIPNCDMEHCLIIIQKIKETDKNFPRSYGRISKKPL